MLDLTVLLPFVETSQFFQFELLALLASLVASLFLSQSLPYFAASALCFLTSLIALSCELYRDTVTSFAHVEVTAAFVFTILFTAKLTYTIICGFRATALRAHAATTLTCSVFLSIKAISILQDTARPVDLHLDRCTLIAVGFAAMHLLAALLQLHDSAHAEPARERCLDEKCGEMV